MQKSEYYTILTKIGIAKFIAARASGNGVNLAKFKISSKVILPNEDMQSLEEVVYEANINSKTIDEKNKNYINLMCHVPSNIGGFEVNSVGIYDDEDNLIAIGNTPRTYKPLLNEGSAKELVLKIVMELSNADEVILKLDPSVIMASRDYVDAIKLELELKIDALMKKYDAEFEKIWKEFEKYVSLTDNENISGVKNFTNLPTSNLQANKDNEFVNLATLKKQVPLLGDGIDGKIYERKTIQNNVIYTNSANKPMVVFCEISSYNGRNGYEQKFILNNKEINPIFSQTSYQHYSGNSGDFTETTTRSAIFAIIPPNATYKIYFNKSGLYIQENNICLNIFR